MNTTRRWILLLVGVVAIIAGLLLSPTEGEMARGVIVLNDNWLQVLTTSDHKIEEVTVYQCDGGRLSWTPNTPEFRQALGGPSFYAEARIGGRKIQAWQSCPTWDFPIPQVQVNNWTVNIFFWREFLVPESAWGVWCNGRRFSWTASEEKVELSNGDFLPLEKGKIRYIEVTFREIPFEISDPIRVIAEAEGTCE